MKFITKLFFGVTIILAVALSFAEYYSVSYTFKNNLNNQTNEALRKHQIIKYAVQANMVSAQNQDKLNAEVLKNIAVRIGDDLETSIELDEIGEAEVDSEQIIYSSERIEGKELVVVHSDFSKAGFNLRLKTEYDISFVFQENKKLQSSTRRVFVVVIIVGTIFSFILAYGLTRPIKRLSRAANAYSNGDYSVRVEKKTNDEIGSLTSSFNEMADSIQEKIDELNLAVKQRENFNASFAHELKTPMTGIIGYADMIYQNKLDEEQTREVAGYIMNEAMRLEALSFKLLELITLERDSFILEALNTGEIFEDILNGCKPLEDKRNVKLTFEVEECYVRVEYDLFKTMIINLVDNASKSGATDIRVKGIRREGDGAIKYFYVSVTDNGRGIPEDELGRITEAFYMVDKSRSRKEHGAGLGLALCDKIAGIHGSKLKIFSKEGKGTKIMVRLLEDEYYEEQDI